MRLPSILLFLTLAWLSADVRECHIIHTTDIHAQLQPRYEGNGGWLKAATVIKGLRQRLPQDQTLLIDTGDSTQGTVAASLTQGAVGVVPLKKLAYDAWVPGNHEFNFGIPVFTGFMDDLEDIALCANLAVNGHKPFTPWRLFTRNKVKIAVIGLTSSFMKNWLLPEDAGRIDIQDGPTCLKRILPDVLAAQPDVVVIAAHQGWFRQDDKRGVNELNAIAEQFPEIDLILGAHTHRTVPGCVIGQRTWYVQPGDHAESVAHITIKADTDAHKTLEVSSVLCPVDQETAIDEDLRKAVTPFTAREIAERKRPLEGYLGAAMLSRGTCGVSCATSELIAAAILEAAHANVVFCGRFTNKDVPPGPLTADILYKLIPYDNTIVTAELTLDDLKAIIEEQWRWRKNYSYSPPHGLRAVIDQDGACTILGFGRDKPLPDDAQTRRFKVAFHNHAAAGSGRFVQLRKILEQPQSKLMDTQISLRKALEEFLAAHKGMTGTPFKWLELK